MHLVKAQTLLQNFHEDLKSDCKISKFKIPILMTNLNIFKLGKLSLEIIVIFLINILKFSEQGKITSATKIIPQSNHKSTYNISVSNKFSLIANNSYEMRESEISYDKSILPEQKYSNPKPIRK